MSRRKSSSDFESGCMALAMAFGIPIGIGVLIVEKSPFLGKLILACVVGYAIFWVVRECKRADAVREKVNKEYPDLTRSEKARLSNKIIEQQKPSRAYGWGDILGYTFFGLMLLGIIYKLFEK